MYPQIVDLSVGNINSIVRMLRYLGYEPMVRASPTELDDSGPIILPGVGSFDYAVSILDDRGWREKIVTEVTAGRPILGICLGMQLLLNSSDEGVLQGLGLIDGSVVKFDHSKIGKNKIPHMGWSWISSTSDLFPKPRAKYYHVHKYHAQLVNPSDELARSHHGYAFTSAIQRNNVTGVQFHPEKSHKFGLYFLDKYLSGFQ